MVVIESFPKNDKEYLVLWHGAVRKNYSLSTNPLVEVLVQELDSGDCYTMIVGVTELDVIRVATCWVNGKKVGTLSEIYGQQIVNEIFEFDLSTKVPEFIRFGEKLKDNRLIPTKKFNLPFVKFEDAKPSEHFSKYQWPSYQNTRLNKLQSIDNQEVLISSLETLTSLYTPSRKEIRRLILTKSPDYIVNKLIKKYQKNIDGNYSIETKDQSLGNVPIVFLAYLANEPHVKAVVDWLQDSLEIAGLGKDGKPFINRYPEIKPYHPKGLKFSASGIWLEEQKKFLVLRVNSVVAPEEITITLNRTITNYEEMDQDTEEPQAQPRVIRKARETHVTSNKDPGKNSGESYIMTEVESSVGNGVLTEIYKIDIEENNEPKQLEYSQKTQETVEASAGEVFGTQSRVAKLENQTQDEFLDQLNVLRGVWQGLCALPALPNTNVQEVVCLTENGYPTSEFYRINVLSILIANNLIGLIKSNEKWLKKFGGRKILIVQVTMIDGSKRFILEVERTARNESYQGVYFTQSFVGKQFINEVCQHLPSDRILVKISSLVRGKCERFLHRKGKNEEWYQKMSRLLASLPRS